MRRSKAPILPFYLVSQTCYRYIKSVYGEYIALSRYYVFTSKPNRNKSGRVKTSFCFFCIANTPPEICKKQNGSRAHAHQSRQSARQKAGTHPAALLIRNLFKYFYCIGNKNKPPAMQVCSQTALASSKKPPCYNEYKVRQPNHYNKEESKWTIIVYHTQNGHANII